MPVHEVAARGFGDGAEAYERARPSYPPAALDLLTEHVGIGPGARVCDLGAGTGKLTRLLAGTGADPVAVEPLPGMHTVLHRELPEVTVVAGVAEALPLRVDSLDAVVVAQAFHWFDAPAALAEIRRVLRPGGRLGLCWNAWDDSVGWLARVHQIVGAANPTTEWTRGHWSRDWVVDAIDTHGGFGPVARAQVPYRETLSRDAVLERVATTSHVASAPEPRRAETLAAVRTVLDDDPATRGRDRLEFAYVVDVFWCARR